MSTTEPAITIKDSITFTLNEADLTGKKVGEALLTPKRAMPCSGGLQWWVDYRPAGETKAVKGYVSVFLWVNKPVKANYTFAVDGSSISKKGPDEFVDSPDSWGWDQFASHEQLRPLFRAGKLTIRCNIEFEIVEPVTVPRVFQLFEHVPTDVQFVIESKQVPAHKSFLALISPVFQAMFAHITAESKSGRIEITEYDFDTVKTVIDFCYGRQWKTLSVETAVGMLRFCDKYFITAVINELEKLPLLHPSVSTFCTVVQYAYDCNKDALLAECYTFFKEHQDEIKTTEKFGELRPRIAMAVLKAAFGLTTDFDILRHAHKNGIEFVLDYLEAAYLESLTIDNFCDAVSYACDCSREELQLACAKYFNNNRDEVEYLKAFRQLKSDTIGKVLKASLSLKYGDV